eukprot:TCALIF_09568-PA protein Name:"Protein of unknown function" AED:0.23 eAED:0.23 QI:77/0/0.8/1/1/1/5/0/132
MREEPTSLNQIEMENRPNVQADREVPLAHVPMDSESAVYAFTINGPIEGTVVSLGAVVSSNVIVDASDACHTANFVMSGTGTRSWDIKVTQYKCGDEMGATHLSNQLYSMCWRQEVGTCGICWEVVNTGQDT